MPIYRFIEPRLGRRSMHEWRGRALRVLAILFVLIILLHYATVLTKLSGENKRLAQELALLRQELKAGLPSASDDQSSHDEGKEQG